MTEEEKPDIKIKMEWKDIPSMMNTKDIYYLGPVWPRPMFVISRRALFGLGAGVAVVGVIAGLLIQKQKKIIE